MKIFTTFILLNIYVHINSIRVLQIKLLHLREPTFETKEEAKAHIFERILRIISAKFPSSYVYIQSNKK